VRTDELEGLKTDWAKMVLRCWDTLDTRQAAANVLTPPVINRADAEAVFRALAGLPGSEPVEPPSPSRTVISGATVNFSWAKAMRFTDDGHVDYSGDAVVTTKGSQHVYIRNIGPELKITPTDVADNRTISVDFHWSETEFDGVAEYGEYGGQSVAGSGREASPSTPPTGFLQPVFSTREINRTIMVPNGATLVVTCPIHENGNLPDSKTETSSRIAPRAVLKARVTLHVDPPPTYSSWVFFITATIVDQPAAK
jgi:hypothetical protein